MSIEREFDLSPEEVSEKEIWFAMGYRNQEPEKRVRDLALFYRDSLVRSAKIRYMYRIVEAEKISPTEVLFDGKHFTPNGIICSYLKGMTHALVFVGTAGWEFDKAVKELNKDGDIVADFVADSIGSVLAEMSVARIETDYKGEFTLSMPYSPGYCDWDIREQKIMFSLFPEHPCGIRLTDSSLMQPEKSVSGFFALGKELQRQPYHCEICKNQRCFKRRLAM